MTWQEWLGSLLMLLGIGGIVILLAEALCCLLRLDRKRPEPEEFEEPTEYTQNRERQLRAMAKSFDWVQSQAQRLRQIETAAANAAGPQADADADALVAQISREIEAEAARIAKRCEVRR